MEYTLEFDDINGLCKVQVTGEFKRPEDTRKLQLLTLDYYRENGCNRFLIDMTQSHIHTTTMNTFQCVQVAGEMDHTILRLKIAGLYENIDEDKRFLETAARNQGQIVRVFNQFNHAIAWLKSKQN